MNVTIYTKPDCAFCSKAKMLLANHGISYAEYILGEDFSRETLVEMFPQARTYPVIVIDGFNIGGFTELKAKLDEEKQSSPQKLLTEEQ